MRDSDFYRKKKPQGESLRLRATSFFLALLLALPRPHPQTPPPPGRGARPPWRSGEPYKLLARADTPHRESAALVDAAGIQATTAVVQEVLVVATARGSRPPEAEGASTAERAIVVAATIDRREGGGVASNAFLFAIGWQTPALWANVLGGVLLRSIVADRSS